MTIHEIFAISDFTSYKIFWLIVCCTTVRSYINVINVFIFRCGQPPHLESFYILDVASL